MLVVVLIILVALVGIRAAAGGGTIGTYDGDSGLRGDAAVLCRHGDGDIGRLIQRIDGGNITVFVDIRNTRIAGGPDNFGVGRLDLVLQLSFLTRIQNHRIRTDLNRSGRGALCLDGNGAACGQSRGSSRCQGSLTGRFSGDDDIGVGISVLNADGIAAGGEGNFADISAGRCDRQLDVLRLTDGECQ